MHDLDWTVEDIVNHYRVHLSHRMTEEEMLEKAKRSFRSYQLTKDFCKNHAIALMSQRKYEGVPGWEFPLEKIIQKYDCDLFTSGVCYAIAYALFKKATRIDLYGVNCIKDEEWSNLREGIMAWLGIAKGLRVKVTVTGLDLRPFRAYDGRLYGYNIPQPAKGMPEQDGIVNLSTGEEQVFTVWREV